MSDQHTKYHIPTTPPPPYPCPQAPSEPLEYHNPVVQRGVTVVPGGVTLVSNAGTTVVTGGLVGVNPTLVYCRSCQAEVVTRVETVPSMRTHLLSTILCLIGAWCCVCIPYCVNSCQSIVHHCPTCNAYLGTYDR